TPAITDPETGRVITKAIKARKPRKAKEAKDRLAGAYEDDAAYAQSIDPEARAENGMGAPIGWEHVSGPFTRLRYVYYNLGSNAQIIEYLTRYTKWEHTELTKTGNPKLTDDSYDSIGIEGIGEMMKEFLIRKSRRTNVLNFKNPSKGWLNNIRPDGRVTPINHSMGTPTARSRHANIVNVPSGGALLGMEMRQCWTAYESGLMLGSDAAGLEARVLAHFMEDEETANEIVHGDFHTEIWNLIPDFSDSRGNTKTIEYALTQ
ncbi:MAG: hypothetical protein HRT61_19965, partial [Ekhidna sp.]|nr:hypothetical protein [Ekhidna sp.]